MMIQKCFKFMVQEPINLKHDTALKYEFRESRKLALSYVNGMVVMIQI